MTPHIFVVLNLSLSPAPESITGLAEAQVYASKHGINATTFMLKQIINGYAVGNQAATDVLDNPQYTHLFFSSDDVIIPPHTLVRLVQDDKDVVQGIYMGRSKTPGGKVCVCPKANTDVKRLLRTEELVEMDLCMGHSMLIKRHVLQTVADKFKEMNYRGKDGETIHGIFTPFVFNMRHFPDDWAFSARARSCGFSCWADFGVRLKHRDERWMEVSNGYEGGEDEEDNKSDKAGVTG